MSIERTPKITNVINKTEDAKQVFKERQPFQTKTPPTVNIKTTKLPIGTQSKLNENNKPPQVANAQAHSSHLASHMNQQTPVNRNIKNLFNSNPNGSAKQDNSIKKPVSNFKNQLLNSAKSTAKLSTPSRASSTSAASTSMNTPSSRLNHLNSSKLLANILLTNSKQSKPPINTIINGIDYADIIARKPELGYTGPGYIISYDCDEKYLKGYIVPKGYWRLKSYQSSNVDNKLNIGPTQWLVNAETETKTPNKNSIINFDFNYNPAPITPSNFNVSTQLDNHYDTKKSKKHLTWFDTDVVKSNILESIVESSSSTPQNDITLNNSNTLNQTSAKKKKIIRRSYSHNDLENIILAQDDEDDAENQVYYDNNIIQQQQQPIHHQNQILNISNGVIRLNETFELTEPKSAHKIVVSPRPYDKNIPVYDLNASCDSLNAPCLSSSVNQSIDNIKINEISQLSNESEHISWNETSQLLANLSNLIKNSHVHTCLLNASNSTKIVASDCSSYMQLSNQINQLIQFGLKCKDNLVLKKV